MEFLEINQQDHLTLLNQNKLKYGEVKTSFDVIEKYFLENIPDYLFKNKNLTWLDPGAGTGNFSICVFKRLMFSLSDDFPNLENRKNHIIEHMLHIVEINPENIKILKKIFGEKANIYYGDFLTFQKNVDIIIGNPPYNSDGMKKVPTNLLSNKKNDGKTIWTYFVKHSLNLLKENGFLQMIVPAIWMKPDKANMYYLITQYKIHLLQCFSNTETNKMFHGQAQTPTSIFLLQKKTTDKIIPILSENTIHNYCLKKDYPIPMMGVSVINKLIKYTDVVGCIEVIKTNLPGKHVEVFEKRKSQYNYVNVTTCVLNRNKPEIIYNYSHKPCPYYGMPKLIMAHGMYGFPIVDKEGKYGISNRDKYIIIDKTEEELELLRNFLSTKLALFLFECTKYRMKYLEKYIFEFIPDVTKIKNFPREITNQIVYKYFNLNDDEIEHINSLHKKSYVVT